ncbi:hypothetical protein BVX97_04265 [bacterium E08(2017)]|nr:hypothetical protein BVX97_04265 [bacterium E08(2017)]
MSGEARVLVVAYACSPYQGSEQGVGWGWVRMIARTHAVTVITAERYRNDIEKFMNEGGSIGDVRFEYVEHHWSKTLDRIYPPYYLWTYNNWLDDAYEVARGLIKENEYKVCHLVTYVGYRHPGKFYMLDCPFVWGPIGGLENTAWGLLPVMGFKGAFYYAMRNIINSCEKRFLAGPKRAFRKADAVIAATSGIREEINKWYDVEADVICEIGAPDVTQNEVRARAEAEEFRICWSGEHLPGKALPLLFKALVNSSANWQLDILGDGPDGPSWKKMCDKMGLGERCNWHGKVPREDALKVMSNAHVLVITSLKDLTSSVLLEALSLGLPVICPDHCGFSDVVDETCGVKVAAENAEAIIEGTAAGLETLMRDEEKRVSLGHGALERVKAYTWTSKAWQLDAVYSKVLSSEESNEL